MADSNRLALFLRLKEVYRSGYSGLSKEYESLFNYNLLSDKKNLKLLQGLVSRQTYLYPRLHSCLPLILNDISKAEETKAADKARLTQTFLKSLLDEHLFNEDVYQEMKSTSKFKFLHIGLKLWQLTVASVGTWDTKCKHREALLESLITPNFIKVLVKNVSNPKAQLHEEATQVKNSLVAFFSSSELSSVTAYKLLTSLFGPNTLTRLSIRKHVDLVKVLCGRMEAAQIKQYQEHMKKMFESPQVEETFGKLMQFKEGAEDQPIADEDSEDDARDEKQKSDIIRTFALN